MCTTTSSNKTYRERRLDPGFSLIELLIVVAIILIIAAIAIPNFMRARMAANESAAAAMIPTLTTVCAAASRNPFPTLFTTEVESRL